MPRHTTFFSKYFEYDPTCDAGYINIPNKDRVISETINLGDCVNVDKNAAGEVVGVEILQVERLMREQGLETKVNSL